MHIPMVFLVRNRENQESQPIVEPSRARARFLDSVKGLGSIPGLSHGSGLDSCTQSRGLGSIPGLSHGHGLDSWTQSRAWALGSRAHIDGLEIIGIADRNSRQYDFAL